MAVYPKIESPCPYVNNLSSVMSGSYCRMCRRTVVDLTNMTDQQRLTLVAGCKTQVCVSYRIPAAALATATLTTGVLIASLSLGLSGRDLSPVCGGDVTFVGDLASITPPANVELVDTPRTTEVQFAGGIPPPGSVS